MKFKTLQEQIDELQRRISVLEGKASVLQQQIPPYTPIFPDGIHPVTCGTRYVSDGEIKHPSDARWRYPKGMDAHQPWCVVEKTPTQREEAKMNKWTVDKYPPWMDDGSAK